MLLEANEKIVFTCGDIKVTIESSQFHILNHYVDVNQCVFVVTNMPPFTSENDFTKNGCMDRLKSVL